MSDTTWAPVTVTLDSLTPWDRNPKTISKTHAKRLLDLWQRLGQFQTIAIGPAGEVYDGHQRLSVLMAAHGPRFQVQALQASRALTEKEREELTIGAHVGTTGQFDWGELANWDSSDLQAWGLDDETAQDWRAGLAALDAMLGAEADEPPEDQGPQIDRAEELRHVWGVEVGQLWQLGEHRLICGDCTDAAVVARVMGGEKAQMVIADPPYGVNIVAANGYVGGGEGPNGMIPFGGVKGQRRGFVGGGEGGSLRHGHYAIEENKRPKRFGTPDGAKPFGSRDVRGSDGATNVVDVGKYMPIVGDDTTETAVKASAFYLDLFPDAGQFWWGGNYYADKLKPSSCWVVWDKETTGNFADCELAWSNLSRSAKLFRHQWNGMLRDSERERRLHPTQKPAALAEFLMIEFGKDGDIVVDPFAGAGWVVVAAERRGLKARAIEIVPEYVGVILQRWADLTGQTPVLVTDPVLLEVTG